MKFNPVVSVILGFIVFFILGIISLLLRDINPIFNILTIIGTFFGGFVATYFAKESNVKYGIYEGIMLIIYFILIITIRGLDYGGFIFTIFWVLLFTGLGGYLGKRGADGYLRSFHPLAALIIGFIVTFVLLIFVVAIMDYLLPNVSDSIFNLIISVALMVSLIIGGFITIYISREKKLRYGIYLGVLAVLTTLIWNFLLIGQLTQFNPLIKILATAGYLLTPTIGSYIGIKTKE